MSRSYLPLNRGLNVLYGLNGAGKSMVLQVLHALLAGRGSHRFRLLFPRLIVGLNDRAWYSVDEDPEWYRQLNHDVLPLYAELTDTHSHEDLDMVDDSLYLTEEQTDALEQRAYHRIQRHLADYVRLPDGVDRGSVVNELLDRPLFAFRPDYRMGADGPQFMVDVLFRPSSSRPILSELAAAKRQSPEQPSPVVSMWPERTNHSVPGWVSQSEDVWGLEVGIEWQAAPLGLAVYGMQPIHPNDATAAFLSAIRRAQPSRESPPVRIQELFDQAPGGIDEGRLLASLQFLAVHQALNRTPSGRRLLQRLEDVAGDPWLAFQADGRVDASCGLAKVLQAVSITANRIYARLLLDAPVLEVQVPHPESTITGSRVEWGARRGPRESLVPLDDLSSAEQAWAAIAIELALDGPQPGFLLIDEPEGGLHRSAEAFMAEGLMEIAREWHLCVVTATHSPELLNAHGASVNLVRRLDQGLVDGRQIHQLRGADREQLLAMGLLPSDLLRRLKGFLFVEGQHDLIVLDTLIGDELRRLRIEMLPLRGAGRLKSALDSRVLYDFTDAHVFVLLDALNSTLIQETWTTATRLAKTEGASAAIMHVTREMSKITADEAQALGSFMARALELGLQDRHTPLAMSAVDILDYLPVSAFVPGAASWQSLREELARDLGCPSTGSQFKKWLTSSKGARLTDETIREAAASITPPSEVTQHLRHMEEIVQGVRP